ncbi:protein serine/threonine phosphatase [Cellulomonas flavigena DSM 20109]|uniref:Protein serine/threonine phosphatase n=1 Tax=Cellulomonas flavigena (strain ATCC 482 / DSM 20109 / BCRC 11376 / JCM 18109 / NBRC 3775 / NCIMB 8073 / NRS 134) TaxID=446466 RepID=D5ULY0_CELFN|nr:PP2C family protein-serine/threonine phosphatase [Cellulomonas flavigena]ADG76086.1 protein serine/threonine phosphatase [Cellulomonas flavigena DSM 20109]
MGDGADVDPVPGAEEVVGSLLEASHLAAPHEVPALVADHALRLGAQDPVLYLVDLEQSVLVPFTGPGQDVPHDDLPIDETVAGRAFRRVDVETQETGAGHGLRVWLPLLDGTDRLGVLGVLVPDRAALTAHGGLLELRLRRLAAAVAGVVVSRRRYGDTIVVARRRATMSLAGEIQWALLPPLTFGSRDVVVAAALEPAYEVAGDSVDYAVDEGRTCVAAFDAMGHGLASAQLAGLTVAAYRNARRDGRTLLETAREIDDTVLSVHGGRTFVTGVLAELDTDTGVLRWVCAGHPRPLLLRDGRVVRHLDDTVGVPFGVADDEGTGERGVGAVRLEPGDRVVLYSDGITEARSPNGTFFGLDRLVALLTRTEGDRLPPSETVRRVVRDLLVHQQGRLQDDATLLVVEWRRGHHTTLLPDPAPPRTP